MNSDYANLRVVLGSTERRGAWAVPRHLDVRVLLGSVELDLTSARLAPGLTVIDVEVTLGSVEIIVTPEMSIEVGMSALAASVDETTGVQPEEPMRPIVRIVGDARLASCEIVRRAA
jgi:hypothetical protein